MLFSLYNPEAVLTVIPKVAGQLIAFCFSLLPNVPVLSMRSKEAVISSSRGAHGLAPPAHPHLLLLPRLPGFQKKEEWQRMHGAEVGSGREG